MSAATPLARRVLEKCAMWTCAHPRRPLQVYALPGLKRANLCVLCAFDLSDRLHFPVSDIHLSTLQRLNFAYGTKRTWQTLLFASDLWLYHMEDCKHCERARNAIDMCRRGQRIFLEAAARGGKA